MRDTLEPEDFWADDNEEEEECNNDFWVDDDEEQEEHECDHWWKFVGQNHHGSYYVCKKCGLEEEA